MDITRSETVEHELTRLIEKRADQRRKDGELTASQEAATQREALWAGSVRRYNARVRAERRAAWYGWHMDQAERLRGVLEPLIAFHEEAAEKLMEPEGRETA